METEAKVQIETERRFLLEQFPAKLLKCQSLMIFQAYLPDKLRIRVQVDPVSDEFQFFTNRKERTQTFSYIETETEISREEFLRLLPQAVTGIFKVRTLYYHRGLKWEIDYLSLADATIAEVELPSESYPLEVPKYLQQFVLEEVTSRKDLTNRALSTPEELDKFRTFGLEKFSEFVEDALTYNEE